MEYIDLFKAGEELKFFCEFHPLSESRITIAAQETLIISILDQILFNPCHLLESKRRAFNFLCKIVIELEKRAANSLEKV